MLIYVAGPYSAGTPAERMANTERAMAAGLAILERGHWPLIPHLSHFFDAFCAASCGRLPSDLYYAWDNELLRRCDALLFLGPSPGANDERALATTLGLPVFLRLDDIPDPESAS